MKHHARTKSAATLDRGLRRSKKMLERLVLSTLLLWTSCAEDPALRIPIRPAAASLSEPLPATTDGDAQTLVLVAIDGVRWQEVFLGVDPDLAQRQGMAESEVFSPARLMPNLRALVAGSGAAIGAPGTGEPMRASGPAFVSVPGYQEMLTGLSPTGCTTNGCDVVSVTTLADEVAAQPGSMPGDAAVISSWEGVLRAASRSGDDVAVSTGRTRGKNRGLITADAHAATLMDLGERAGPAPGHGDFRRDRVTADIALRYLEARKPRFLFLGLGETDERAHMNDYRGYLAALQQADRIVADVAGVLARLAREGRRATLLVTTDHGRSWNFHHHGADAPESARVWMVAAGWGIRARGLVAATEPRRLADVAATARSLLGLEQQLERGGKPLVELLGDREHRLAHR